MAELMKVHPLADLVPSSDIGLSEMSIDAGFDRPIVQLFAKNGQHDAVAGKLKIAAVPGQATANKNMTAFPLSPGQWILVGQAGANKIEFSQSIVKKVAKLGYVSEQGDSRVCFRVSGTRARELMSRGCRLDLHPAVTSAGFCAQTNMAQIGVLLHQVDNAPTYDLYVYSGFSRSFWQWLSHTAAQFGYLPANNT